MKKALIIGSDKNCTFLVKVLSQTDHLEVIGIVCHEKSATRSTYLEHKLHVYDNWKSAVDDFTLNIIIEMTGSTYLYKDILAYVKERDIIVIPHSIACILLHLLEEKEDLIDEISNHHEKIKNIVEATHDGMIAIDSSEKITLMNRRAEQISSISAANAIGKKINHVIPSSQLPRVLQTKEVERNKKQFISKDKTIVTTRVPMMKNQELIGALGVFKDVTEITKMAEEVTNLKSVQTMLEAIINSSNDAISVVDEKGIGMLINPAYTRLTGLTKDKVLGQPATADISEGESMHLKVLKTKMPVRGVRMKVGPAKRDVIVNVAPVIVDDHLKGSVAVIHDRSEIVSLSKQLEQAKQMIRTLEAKYCFKDIIGHSVGIQTAIAQAKVAAATPVTILLRGESGTGKELFAHAIHNESDRKYNKFIRVNCAAISETLLESELFGYEEGAFSGAKRGGKKGFFEEAHKGSIFLDEIGELSPPMQAKLLRVLQEREIVRVGSTKAITIDVRVIAATNDKMEEKIANNQFRADLYYRLNRMPIFIPPLRDRCDDFRELAEHMFRKLNKDYGRNVTTMSAEVLEALQRYNWPGNVRELENILGMAMIYMHYTDNEMQLCHLPAFPHTPEKNVEGQPDFQLEQCLNANMSLQEILESQEKKILKKVLANHNGNKTQTAKVLKISIRNLYYKLKKHHVID
ncbi:sigma-54-dependent Fis family transcriptional regulator [Salipaludibacillus sp. LMS25]|jgi:PAS domain S-box-containing protein|uniref:sigma-54 interaction domain-containing protein n=1 Tax=Salipaludibacillus sp. LMS25 TaxID=2924031 RepID=UPI0020D06F9E|nr:sigma-54-dependent Fis family transcriptional regulator [Salipaludibacillus sp. LMS25]UTR14504.1 sigma-54-dependent Fis family transcriptional regulator [Salipaludibacillus sp. LMS25]